MENEKKYIHTQDLDIEYIESYLEDIDIDDKNLIPYCIEHISIHELTKDNELMRNRLLNDLKKKILKNGFKKEVIYELNRIVTEYKKFQEELGLKMIEDIAITRDPLYLEFRRRFP